MYKRLYNSILSTFYAWFEKRDVCTCRYKIFFCILLRICILLKRRFSKTRYLTIAWKIHKLADYTCFCDYMKFIKKQWSFNQRVLSLPMSMSVMPILIWIFKYLENNTRDLHIYQVVVWKLLDFFVTKYY